MKFECGCGAAVRDERAALSRLASPWGIAAAVLLAVLAGAAIGAVARPAPSNPYRAESIVAIQPDVPPSARELALQRARWHKAAEALKLPQVLSRTAALAHLPESGLGGRLSARGRPESGLFVVRARGPTPPAAVHLAAAASHADIAFLRMSTGTAGVRRASFDFEGGTQGWGTGASVFLFPPKSVRGVRGGALVGHGLLRTTCVATRAGCGVWVSVRRTFLAGTVYSATAGVRVTQGSAPLRLALGNFSGDVANGSTKRVSQTWSDLRVQWTPRVPVGLGELDVVVSGPGPVTFDTDQVAIRAPDGAAPPPAGTDRADRYRLVGVAQRSGRERFPTPRAALVGAGIGLLAALAGLGFGLLAAQRRRAGST